MTEQHEEKYLTPDEACKFLGVTRKTLDRYVKLGRITKYRRDITRAVFFKQSELDRLMEIRPDEEEGRH